MQKIYLTQIDRARIEATKEIGKDAHKRLKNFAQKMTADRKRNLEILRKFKENIHKLS